MNSIPIRRQALRGSAIIATAIAAMSANAAAAQQTTPPVAAPPITAGGTIDGQVNPAGTQPSTSDTAVATQGDIIVTAQRRAERLQDVPATITALTSATLEHAGVVSTKQLSLVTPGLNFTQSAFSPQPTIRGIGTRGVTPGDESVVPVYVDGVYQPVIISTVMDLNSVERIEVLKGPQGTLFGRNATGGAINIITRTPSTEPTLDGSLSYGRFNEVIGKLYGSVGSGPLSADVALVGRRDDGYIYDVATNKETAKYSSLAVRSKVRYQPSDVFDVTASIMHSYTNDSTSGATQPIDGNTVARRFDPDVLLPSGPFENAGVDYFPLKTYETQGAVTGSLHLGGVDITSISSLQRFRLHGGSDNDTTPYLVGYQVYNGFFQNSFIQELYATSHGSGPFHWIVGGTYYHDRAGYLPSGPIIGANRSLTTGVVSFTSLSDAVTTESFAGYVQGSYDLTDKLNVTVGGRYTQDRKHFLATNNISNATIDTEHTWRKFTPSGTIQYKFSDRANIYAKAGQAFKAGIYPSQTFGATPANPETVTQYELGTKLEGSSGLHINIAGYYTDYKNVQVNVRDPITQAANLENAAAAEIYGIDGDIAYSPVQRLNLRGGISLLHGKYKNYQNAQVSVPTGLGGNSTVFIDASGKNIIRTPFVTLNGGFDYAVELNNGSEISMNFNAYYEGKSYWEASNRVVEHPHTIGSAEIGWSPPGRHFEFSLWGENIFDARYHLFTLSSATADSQVYAKPATYGVRVKFNFGH